MTKINRIRSTAIAGVAMVCGVLSSDAAVLNFTAAEGYVNANLNAHADWNEVTAGAYVVDATTGTASTQGAAAWRKATYVGSGGTLTNNNYVMETTFSLDTTGSILNPGGTVLLGRTGYDGGGVMLASLRQKTGAAGSFDLWIYSNITGEGSGDNGAALTAAAIGLAHDGSGWTDTASDLLKTIHTAQYDSVAGTWTQSAELWNLTTDTLLSSLSREITEAEGDAFLAANQAARIDSGRLDLQPNMTYSYDRILIDQIPEPATLGLIALSGGGLLWVRRFMAM